MPRFNDVRRFDEIDSTNRWVAEQARGGAAEGLVAVAGMQSAGRGRLDRTWIAPSGSALLCTVLVRPQMPMARWHWLNLAMAIAAQDAVRSLGESFSGLNVHGQSGDDVSRKAGEQNEVREVRDVSVESIRASDVAVKWPNDLIVPSMGDRKLAGILAEMVLPAKGQGGQGGRGGQGGQGAVAVGIGLNVRRPLEVDPEVAARGIWLDEVIRTPTNMFPFSADGSADSELSSPDAVPSRVQLLSPTVDEVLNVLLVKFERWVAEVEDHPDAFLETYRQRCVTVGREVRAMLPSSDIYGTATGIDNDGQLLVSTADGSTHTISAADVVHVR